MRAAYLLAAFAIGACGAPNDGAEPEPIPDDIVDGAAGRSVPSTGTGGHGDAAAPTGSGGKSGTEGGAGTRDSGPSTGVGGAGTGGAKGTGGSRPTVDAGPPRSCSGLPAAGTWENISAVACDFNEASGKNFANAVVVDPFDPATVWHGTGYRGIYKSTDCGATFAHINSGRSADLIDASVAGSMAVDPVNQGVIYSTAFMGANGLFKSTNGGVDWDQLLPPGSAVAKAVDGNVVNSVAMDASDPAHLVIGMHANCLAPYGPVCEAESTDAGATWTVTTVPVGVGGWVAGAGAFILDSTTWLFGTYSNGLWLTTDRGATWKNVTPSGASGATGGKTLILPFSPAPDGTYYLAAMEGVLSSKDGRAWSLIPSSGGRTVGFAMGGGHLYAADQWSLNYRTASDADPTKWSPLPIPSGLPSSLGAPFLAYDAAHHLLYSSNWAGGLWRLATP